jgi:hypothetical protein
MAKAGSEDQEETPPLARADSKKGVAVNAAQSGREGLQRQSGAANHFS